MGDAAQLVGCIVVVGLCRLAVGAYEFVAPDVAYGVLVRPFEDCLVTVIDKAHEPAVFFQFGA